MKKISVTIGICAYNEEYTIGALLKALIDQQEDTIQIKEILVYSDGSTDQTVHEVKRMRDPRIKMIEDTVRRGKAYRLNSLFEKAHGKIIVLLDADTIPTSKHTIEYICRPFLNPSFNGLSGGRRTPIHSRSLIATGLGNLFEAYNIVRRELHNGINIYSFLAGVVALHHDFAKTLILPHNSPCDDNHIYLEAKKRRLPLAYVPNAAVWYSPPQTLSDQISQGARYMASIDILSRYFDRSYISSEFFVPLRLRYKVLLFQIVKNPFAYLCLKGLSLLCNIRRLKLRSSFGGIWEIATSTKKIFASLNLLFLTPHLHGVHHIGALHLSYQLHFIKILFQKGFIRI